MRAHDDIVLVGSAGNLGYSGGINAALPFTDPSDALLILNPDLESAADAVTRLVIAAEADRIGAVVPLMVDDAGAIYPSLRREPSLTRAIGDALLGSKITLPVLAAVGFPLLLGARALPESLGQRVLAAFEAALLGFLSEWDARPTSYLEAHDVDWATGAAVLIPAPVAREVGKWNEEFFLYSEETDYFRRIRKSGLRIRFEPVGRSETPRRWIRNVAGVGDLAGGEPCLVHRTTSRVGILGTVPCGGRAG